MPMIKSTKYRNHYMSKYVYSTTIIQGQHGSGGGINLGEDKARRALEQKLGRQLHPDTKVRTKGGNWSFMEPL